LFPYLWLAFSGRHRSQQPRAPSPVVAGPLRLVATRPLRRWPCTLSARWPNWYSLPLPAPAPKGIRAGALDLRRWSSYIGPASVEFASSDQPPWDTPFPDQLPHQRHRGREIPYLATIACLSLRALSSPVVERPDVRWGQSRLSSSLGST
jgi:hypothetical protein